MQSFENNVLETIRSYNMLHEGKSRRVTVALSGGADSVSLLAVLLRLGFDVDCVHVNHCLRGSESDRDEEFCKDLCRSLGVDIRVERVEVRRYCEANRLSIEEGARKLRYEILEGLSPSLIATAHNLDDCLETTLFNLTRGCGLSGITGIPPVRGRIIRPLIRTSREDIERYLDELGLGFVTDSTNLVDDCSRNIIRLKVLPELKRLNPSLLKTYRCELSGFESARDYISAEAKKLFKKNKNGFWELGSACGDAVLCEAIRLILKDEGITPSSYRIGVVKELVRSDGRVNIAGGVYVRGCSGRISFERDEAELYIPSRLLGDVCFGGRRVEFTEISQFDISCYNNIEIKFLMDADLLKGPAVLRSYKGSERIRLAKKGFSQEIKKLLSVYPAGSRKGALVISDSEGAVFVEGFGVCERLMCTRETKTAIRVEIAPPCGFGD